MTCIKLLVECFWLVSFLHQRAEICCYVSPLRMFKVYCYLFAEAYYGEIRSVHVNQAGAVIGILIAVVVFIYIIIVVVVIILIYRRKRREREKGDRLEESPEESSPMLSVPEHGRPRRNTMSDTECQNDDVPINMLQQAPPVSSDEDNESNKSEQESSDDSIHKEKIPTSEEDNSSTPTQTPDLIMPQDSPGSEHSNENNEDIPDPDVDNYMSPPAKPQRQSLPGQQRPPSVEDILAAERYSHCDDDITPPRYSELQDEDLQDAPPLPPKAKSQEYLDMTGSMGRGGSKTFPMAARNGNGSRKLGDVDLPKDDESSIDGDSHVETEAVIEPKPKDPRYDRFDTAV